MSQNIHTFAIVDHINPTTQQPFGMKYAGNFKVHRPNLAEKRDIACRDAATLNIYGKVNQLQMDKDVVNVNYIFSNMDVMADEKPDWFSLGKLYEEDEEVVYAVWKEVQKFLDSFRPQSATKDGGVGSANR
jgi:hypothetical protein